MLRHPAGGRKIKDALQFLPRVAVSCSLAPITRTVLRVVLTLRPEFQWRDSAHGHAMRWVLWVEDSQNDMIYHNDVWTLTKKMMQVCPLIFRTAPPVATTPPVHARNPASVTLTVRTHCKWHGAEAWQSVQEREHRLTFTIPLFEPLASHYYVRLVSEEWLHAESFAELRLAGLRLPTMARPHTDLLPLDPLPRSALGHPEYEALYEGRFTHFNPIQTQAFHTLYHTDESVLLGAPTGAALNPLTPPCCLLRTPGGRPGAGASVCEHLSQSLRRACPDRRT